MKDKNRVIIFDTTMRDGEQSPGASMSLEEKIQISRVFDEMGIDIIEAGFPISSPGDFEAVTAISKIIKNSIPCGLSRALKKDIDACYESLQFAKRFRIHTFISTSPVHMKHKLDMSQEQVLDAIKESVSYARNYTDDVEKRIGYFDNTGFFIDMFQSHFLSILYCYPNISYRHNCHVL